MTQPTATTTAAFPTQAYACKYFALCRRDTITYLDNPVLGPVPCCVPCATVVGATDQLKKIADLP